MTIDQECAKSGRRGPYRQASPDRPAIVRLVNHRVVDTPADTVHIA